MRRTVYFNGEKMAEFYDSIYFLEVLLGKILEDRSLKKLTIVVERKR